MSPSDATSVPSPEGALPATRFGALLRTPALALTAIGLVLTVAALAAYVDHRIGQVVGQQVVKVLQAPHGAALESLALWAEAAERAGNAAASDPVPAALMGACLSGSTCDAHAIDRALAPYARAAGFTRFRLADERGDVYAAGPRAIRIAPLSSTTREQVATLPHAGARVLPPVLDAGVPTLLVGVAIGGPRDERAGALLFDLPIAEIGRVLQAARGGSSFESYAFDRQGRMLSESRFPDQLNRLGLLPEGTRSSVMRLDVRDPGGDLTQGFRARAPRSVQPLTRMAASAVAGHSGVDVAGYRDYRGVPVVGAWHFLPRLGVGVATEIDFAEAYETLHTLERLLALLVGALALAATGLLVAMAIAARLRTRARRAERIAARFGQYRVVRKLGEGGMGVVYLATHDHLRRPAAIKLLRADRVTPDAVELFEREVRITSTLTHPNTVAVYDYGRAADGSLYYAMEYLEGLDLQSLVTHFGPLPPARVLHFLRQLCGSLAEAHAAGLVHRDIKPANLLACTRGGVADTLKVLDFGIAQIGKGDRVHVARDKVVIGTPEYMAPELFESREQASAQTDLYAVGAVAYFLLTGRPPFLGDSVDALCRAHLTEAPEPPSARLAAPIDSALEQALLACLAKRREARPSSAAGLRALLERSPLASAWTPAAAAAWWAAHASEIEALRARAPSDSATPSIRAIHPVPQTD